MDTMVLQKKDGVGDKERPVYLFVCTGNTCRSPMAAALFNYKYGDTAVALSCGIRATGRSPIAKAAADALAARGIPESFYQGHVSRPATAPLLDSAERIICMSADHVAALILDYPEMAGKIYAMPKDIFDPYGCTLEVYKRCLSDIEAGLAEAFGVLGDKDGEQDKC